MPSKIPTTLLLLLALSSVLTGCAVTGPAALTDTGTGIIMTESSPLMWQKNRGQIFTSWVEATDYVNQLELGGYSDWRLPTREELLDLYFVFDFGDANAGELGMVIEGSYWSAEKDEVGFSGSWQDGDSCEITRKYQPTGKGYVRAVRP